MSVSDADEADAIRLVGVPERIQEGLHCSFVHTT